jgi:hypothetical protein
MMEAARTSETLVNFYQTTRCYNPEDSNLFLTVALNIFQASLSSSRQVSASHDFSSLQAHKCAFFGFGLPDPRKFLFAAEKPTVV